MKKICMLFVAGLMLVDVISSHAATMLDYCVTPPFIQETIKPNLLLLFDNSASVFDLAHIDKGSSTRSPYYCYDQTFTNLAGYEGYFKSDAYYNYDMANRYFTEINGITALTGYTCNYSDTAKKNLCVTHNGGSPQVITSFRASGKFLNWMTASKFDVQKKALTGGKYQNGTLIAESRGCVGRGFVKEPLLANYVEGGVANTNIGATLHVKGGGATDNWQTEFMVYKGDYNAKTCQAAIDAYADPTSSPAALKKAVDDCLTSVTNTDTSSLATDQKVVFQQTIQECWQYSRMADPKTVGTDAVTTVTGKCGKKNGVYDKRNAGPESIKQGDPDLLCGSDYTGYCFAGSVSNDWNIWVPRQYTSSDACIIDMHNKFCKNLNVVPVTDPTDSPSVTTDYSNLPAMIADLGVESQLGVPLKLSNGDSSFVVKVNTAVPSGIIQEFGDKIRIGGMSFNEFGSASEAPGLVAYTKFCSNIPNKQCGWDNDCVIKNTDGTINIGVCSPASSNKDGARIFQYIGLGHCSGDASKECTTKANCDAGQTCMASGVGDYTAGFIKNINDMKGATWTPFGEAFYNAIGYFAKDTTDTSGKTSKTSLRINNGDFLAERNPSEYRCQMNNVLMITDGVSTTDRHTDVKNLSDKNTSTGNTSATCSYFAGSTYLENLAWLAKNRNINTVEKNTTATELPTSKSQFIKTYVAFNGDSTGAAGDCDAAVLLSKTATNGGTTMYSANSPELFMASLRNAFSAIAGGAASGTAASILSNSEGSGANILQAVFYPRKEFENKSSATWIGEMQNLWYYVDPYISYSTVREDTDYPVTGVHALDVKKDYVTKFTFDASTNETNAMLYKDTDGNGSGDVLVTSAIDSRVSTQTPGLVNADDVRSIWRAGKLLWARDITANPRTLYTNLSGATATGCDGSFTSSSNGLVNLAAFNWATASSADKCILRKHLNAESNEDAEKIIKFIHGIDGLTIEGSATRSRTVRIGGADKVWKLGDIISSTPRVQSSNKLNNYNQAPPVGYGDTTYANDDTNSGFANSTTYKDRGMVYAGANDGLLHAFKMGKLVVQSSGDTKATLTGDDLGKEEWAFIPRHVLPYLKFLSDPGYAHLNLVDGPSRIVDVSIGSKILSGTGNYKSDGCENADVGDGVSDKTIYNYWSCQRDKNKTTTFPAYTNKSWRTILIGSMGTGGASANSGSACSTTTECVQTPIDAVGFSSYYALDITDPANPTFMWDFKHEDLGYSTTGAAVVRIDHKLASGENDTNGRWFAIIGNGPTGPINTTTLQFSGTSTKDLALFVLDLRDGTLLKKFAPSTAVTKAFVGSITPGAIDINRSEKLSKSYYSDDAVYSGYVQCTANCATATPTWDGGVLRLLTKDISSATFTNSLYPKNWGLSILASGTGPVTASVGKLQDRKNANLWLYAGTGRYFFKDDDKERRGKLIGIKDPCFQMDTAYGKSSFKADACLNAIAFSDTTFLPQTTIDTDAATKIKTKSGWYITLDAQDSVNNFGAERIITDPVAMPNGAVFFTSFMPSTDVCNFGGKSFMWGVQYDTGGLASVNAMHGKALVQVSTGSFEEVDLSTAFTAANGTLGRKMLTPMIGKPPTDPPPIVSASGNKPLKRILHIQEK